jgi:NAD(P)-dependent dehydrogenase (short-subunit alcohol dehydrogenase family)
MACRSEDKARQAIEAIGSDLIEFIRLDLASFASIRQFATDFLNKGLPLHILVNNACPMVQKFEVTEDGHEMMYGAGMLGPFLLTSLLIDKLKESAPSRVIVLSSSAAQIGSKDVVKYPIKEESKWGKMRVYSETKFANAVFAFEMARRLQGTGVVVAAVHPGIIETELSHSMMPSIFFALVAAFKKTVPQGAATTVFCATHAALVLPDGGSGGGFFEDSNLSKSPSAAATSEKLGKRLWAQLEAVCGISFLPLMEEKEVEAVPSCSS